MKTNLIPEPLFAKTINEELINKERNVNQTICDSLRNNYGLDISVRSLQRYRKEDGMGKVPSFLIAKAILNTVGLSDYTNDEIYEMLDASSKYNSLNRQEKKKINIRYSSDIKNFNQGGIKFNNENFDVFKVLLEQRIEEACGEDATMNEYITYLINKDINS